MSIRFPDDMRKGLNFEPAQVVNLHKIAEDLVIISADETNLEPLLTFIFKKHNGIPNMETVQAYETIKKTLKGKTLGGLEKS